MNIISNVHPYFIVCSSIFNVVLMQRNCTWLYNLYIQEELSRARIFLRREMGLDLGSGASNVPINFTKDEINMYIKRFKNLDGDNKGYITVNDLRRYFKVGQFFLCQCCGRSNIDQWQYNSQYLMSIISLYFFFFLLCLSNRIFFLITLTICEIFWIHLCFWFT